MLGAMEPNDDVPAPKRRTRTWWVVTAIVLAGAVLTWLAFGAGLTEKAPPDPTRGVDLVEPRDRTSQPGR